MPKNGAIFHREFKRFGMALFHVAYIAVESGEENKGKWITEKRDFLKDYENAFGSPPKYSPIMIGILTDSNNVNDIATADYDDLQAEKR